MLKSKKMLLVYFLPTIENFVHSFLNPLLVHLESFVNNRQADRWGHKAAPQGEQQHTFTSHQWNWRGSSFLSKSADSTDGAGERREQD